MITREKFEKVLEVKNKNEFEELGLDREWNRKLFFHRETIKKVLTRHPEFNFSYYESYNEALSGLALADYSLFMESEGQDGSTALADNLLRGDYYHVDLGYEILNRYFGQFRVCGTYADAGCVMIGNEGFKYWIGAGGDGRKSVYVIDENAPQIYRFYKAIPFNFETIIHADQPVNIYSYDCDKKDIAYKLPAGEYFVYTNEARIIFEKRVKETRK